MQYQHALSNEKNAIQRENQRLPPLHLRETTKQYLNISLTVSTCIIDFFKSYGLPFLRAKSSYITFKI